MALDIGYEVAGKRSKKNRSKKQEGSRLRKKEKEESSKNPINNSKLIGSARSKKIRNLVFLISSSKISKIARSKKQESLARER
ncbi:hypothetical protein E3N88_16750 [Mikania micrantha]|uniref:Uncharacterized protein n=1 Tax=Mikania micrantha TaxID=192012 RepID=A0A5N6NQG3_9ASTR|nr:hypothetical protein E3N88_16750 [Mikania micrantha]